MCYYEKMKSSPLRNKPKKMQGPTQFIKNTSKRKSPKKQTFISKKKSFPKKTVKKTIKQKSVKIFPSTLSAGQERLERYMAHHNIASRREAKNLIKGGLVSVNGMIIREPGFGVTEKDNIKIHHSVNTNKETILFYKPRGVETVKTDPKNSDIHDRFPDFKHLNPIGRLDKDTEGLILLSNDGVLARMFTDENSSIEKEYHVTVREDIFPVLLKKMEDGIILDKIRTKPCVTKKINSHEYTITLTEGRKHQVRRMANACKLTITKLVRIRINEFKIGKMTAGNYKRLLPEQIEQLKNNHAS